MACNKVIKTRKGGNLRRRQIRGGGSYAYKHGHRYGNVVYRKTGRTIKHKYHPKRRTIRHIRRK